MNSRKIVSGLVGVGLALAMVATAIPVGAAALTSAQVQAIVSLLQSFGADSATIANVNASLTGGTPVTGAQSLSTFNTNLTIGSTGSDVAALQTWLVSNGYLVMPVGVSKGYFGSLTRAAVASYQAAKGITPAVGYFGPITRASLNALVVVIPTPTPTPGCPAGAMYNSITGALCTTTPTPGPTVGVEGSITTKLAASPAANADVRSQVDVPVYGIEVKAISSDMKVDRLDLQFAVTPVGSSAQNPGTFINNIKILDGTTVLKSINVSTADFVKDSSDRYHIIISSIGFNVPVSTSKTVTVSVSTGSISSSDVNRTVAVQGYAGNTNNVRATDTAGFQSYTDMSGSANTRSHTFKPAGASTVTATINSALTPDSTNSKVSSTNGVQKLTMLAFNAKAETGPAILRKLYVQTNATATAGLPSTLFLYDGSTLIASVSASTAVGGQALFTDLSIPVAQDQTKTLLIKTDSASTVAGGAASTTLPVNALQWEKPDGSVASTSNTGAIASSDQYFYGAVTKWTLVSATVDPQLVIGTAAPATTTATFHLTIRGTTDGGSMVRPVLGDFVIRFASSSAATYDTTNATSSSNGDNITASLTSVTPSDATVGDGGTYDVSLTGILKSKNSQGITTISGPYFMVLTSASSSVGGNTITQTWALSDDFKTPVSNIQNI